MLDASSLEEDLRRSTRDLLRLLPVLTAVGLAALYLIGAIVKVGELQAAGVAVGDALPLVPLQQLLATALPVVVDSVILMPMSVAVVYFAWSFFDRLDHHITGVSRRVNDLVARAERIDRRIDPGGDEEGEALDVQGFRQEFDECVMEVERLREVRSVRWLRRVVPLIRRVRLLRYPVGAVAVLGALTMWLATSPLMLVGVAGGVAVAGRLRPRPVAAGVAVYGIFLLAVLLEAYIAPSPLPEATVRTLNGHIDHGRLIAATDGEWHLAVASRRLRSIPVAQIAASEVSSQRPHGAKPTWKILRDLAR